MHTIIIINGVSTFSTDKQLSDAKQIFPFYIFQKSVFSRFIVTPFNFLNVAVITLVFLFSTNNLLHYQNFSS